MAVRLIAMSQGAGPLQGKGAEDIISFAARVSSPQNQEEFDTAPRLIKYCIRNQHYSILETASMTVEIRTSRAIAAQILRHRSFTFQEASQRYSVASSNILNSVRRQDVKNRQNSIDDLPATTVQWFDEAQALVWHTSSKLYEEALEKGIAKECARFLLPLSTETILYMTGTIRSFMHYIQLRSANGTQKEHQDIALDIKKVFVGNLPTISEALGWSID